MTTRTTDATYDDLGPEELAAQAEFEAAAAWQASQMSAVEKATATKGDQQMIDTIGSLEDSLENPSAQEAIDRFMDAASPDDLLDDIETITTDTYRPTEQRVEALARILGAIGQSSPEADAVVSLLAGMAGMI